MTTKKRTPKRTKKKGPTKAMLKELGEVFERHNSRGVTIRFSDSGFVGNVTALTASLADADSGLAPTPDSLNCSPAQSPTFVCKTLANGTIVCGWVCR